MKNNRKKELEKKLKEAKDKKQETPDNPIDYLLKMKEKKNRPNIFVILLGVFVAWVLISTFLFSSGQGKKVPFSQITSEISKGNIEKVEFSETELTAYPESGGEELKSNIPQGTDFLNYLREKQLDDKVQSIEATQPLNIWESFGNIINLLFLGLFVFIIFNMFRARGGGGGGGPMDLFSFGKSKAKLFEKGGEEVSFDDVAVSEEIEDELFEVVDFLKNPEKYRKVGARTPKGILLVGPAGVGKTLAARAIAGEAEVPFYNVAGSEFMEMLVGVGSARVRDMFEKAKKNSPALIFIDEIDAIGRQRGMGIGGGHDEREQTLNQILVEMDGFDKNTNVIVIAATNRPDMLDPALVRPGRFDRKIKMDLPTMDDRKDIIKIHMKGKPFEDGVSVDLVAKRTVGFSGADIENMLNEAAILAARKGNKKISYDHISEAATKVKLGPERKKLQDDEDKKITAYHEAGHAVVAHYNDKIDPVRRISIVARTQSLGHTEITGDKQDLNYTKEKLIQTISMMLGGRTAEEIVFNEQTIGAQNDIDKATDIARRMVTEFGMSDILGPINYSKSEAKKWIAKQLGKHVDYSESTAEKIDKEVEQIVMQAKGRAKEVLTEHRDDLEKIAQKLMEVETLEQPEFEKLMNGEDLEQPNEEEEQTQIASKGSESEKDSESKNG